MAIQSFTDVNAPYDTTPLAKAGLKPMALATVPAAGPVTTTYYKKRAYDSGGPAGSYVTWVTTDPAGAYPGAPPFGGPLVNETILQVWSITV